MADEVPAVSPHEFVRYFKSAGPYRATDGIALLTRARALADVRDPRVFTFAEGGAFTDAVLHAAATSRCDANGFDVEDLITRANAMPRPPLKEINEPWFTEPMVRCEKCGLWWGKSQPATHRPGCSD